MAWTLDTRVGNFNVSSIAKQRKRKAKRAWKAAKEAVTPAYQPGMGKEFYLTREWRSLRWDVLRASDGACMMCGRSRANGVIMHVDHVKPRSKYPELELVFTNLQVLCEDCNLGKSNK